jgi:predicted Rossmann fold nucleotide-binding protein DprA/Smf involved in DNA uptake
VDDRRLCGNGHRGRGCRRDLQASDAARHLKIISGGQTGVDRAALDVALKHGIDCGGWCPAGRLDESGIIPARYPVQESPGGGFTERTRRNVRDSDGTIIIYNRELKGGTAETLRYCAELQRPHMVIDASRTDASETAALICNFVREQNIAVLNVAGPRKSEWPQGYEYALRALDIFISRLSRGHSAG